MVFNLIFCCLKMKSVSNMHCRVFSSTITNIVLNTPYNVLNWFHLQTTRKSYWQPEVSGWIQAPMQQNTITQPSIFRNESLKAKLSRNLGTLKVNVYLGTTYLGRPEILRNFWPLPPQRCVLPVSFQVDLLLWQCCLSANISKILPFFPSKLWTS